MIMGCGGEIIDVERGALALIQVRHRLKFSFHEKSHVNKGES